jgi:hypothetical protein
VESRIGLRLLFAGVIVLLPVQIAASKLIGDEPYPLLFLPGFGPVLQHSSAVEFDSASMAGVLSDGRSVPLDSNAVMPNSEGFSVALQTILSDPVRCNAEDTKAWLRQRLAAAYPDLEIASVNVIWNHWAYDEETGRRTATDTGRSFSIALADPR